MADYGKELRRVAEQLASHAAHSRQLQEQRRRLIAKASKAGMTRKAVGDAAGLTPGRVQQILDGD